MFNPITQFPINKTFLLVASKNDNNDNNHNHDDCDNDDNKICIFTKSRSL